ncbi:MAG: hypothetical protein M1815_003181 [Lichina confinis]|nr:MAG: hypothetical protein M1815_003181 [Lichina confinis]
MATTIVVRGEVEPFKGEPSQNAVRWLRRFQSQHQIDLTGREISPAAWLCAFDSYLVDEAAAWADKTPIVREMLAEGAVDSATAEDVAKVKCKFLERFQPPETTGIGGAIQSLLNLKQGDAESLDAYYTRTLSLLLETGGCDDPEGKEPDPRTDTLLPVAIERFISGLQDNMLGLKMRYQCIITDDSLRDVYRQTLETAKHLEAKAKAKAKTEDERRKHRELETVKGAVRSIVKMGYGQLIPPPMRPILVGMQGLGIVQDDFETEISAQAPGARRPPWPYLTAPMQPRRPQWRA